MVDNDHASAPRGSRSASTSTAADPSLHHVAHTSMDRSPLPRPRTLDAMHEPHEHEHGQQHQPHQHGHSHGDDFDWAEMAERLELDAAITEPIVHEVLAELPGSIREVLDVGCGPGAVAIAIARALPAVHVTALDASAELLEHVAAAAAQAGVGDRLDTVRGDLEVDLPPLPAADLVWAGMVVHHVTDPRSTLRRLLSALTPGGTLVMVEFGDTPRVLPDGDPLLADGTWSRFQAATSAVFAARLGLDPVAVDWPSHLHAAGYVDVVDTGRVAVHPAPLDEVARRWLVPHLERGVEMAADRLSDDDAARILALAAAVPARLDLQVRAARRVLMARRPAAEPANN